MDENNKLIDLEGLTYFKEKMVDVVDGKIAVTETFSPTEPTDNSKIWNKEY